MIPLADYTAEQAETDVLGILVDLVDGYVPALLAVCAGIVGLVVLAWGLRTVFRKVMVTAGAFGNGTDFPDDERSAIRMMNRRLGLGDWQ